MKLYCDIWTGTQIISDSYPFNQIFEGTAVEVKARWVVKGDEKVDVGCGNAFGGGEQEEANDTHIQKVIDVVDYFQYSESGFPTKEDFEKYFKGYMKKILAHLTDTNPDRVGQFKTGGAQLFKFLKKNYADLTIYTPQDYDTENSLIYSYYQGEDIAPTFIYVMDGLKSTKV